MIGAFLSGGSPEESIRRAAALREEAEAELKRRLSGEALAQVQGMLEVCRPHVHMSEGRARWQLTIAGSIRPAILALGKKLVAAGALAEPNDAFYLNVDELKAAAANPSSATLALVEQRKADLAESEKLQPPPFLGAEPDMSQLPPEAQAVFTRFFGLGVAPSTDANVITGNAASKGVVTGTARVIKDLADSGRLEPGDILVCTLTAPPWTPLFAIAGAVVTDTGGVMSHSGICAREFAIPCVVGTQVGTALIKDGSTITVDGDKGIVRLG
jgi:pyruvate,water dikinase